MVNIIMPVYNAHNTLRQAIGSVIMQDDLDNILLTIVDDCSTEPYDYLLDESSSRNVTLLSVCTLSRTTSTSTANLPSAESR